MNKPVLAWHFVGETLRDGRAIPADGKVLRHRGSVRMCSSGLHASRRIIDALRYAPGSTICRVEMRDIVGEDIDKLVARERVILWRVNGDAVLREFARTCALEVLHVWAGDHTPGIDVVVEWLLTGDSAAQWAAYLAAYSAAQSAAAQWAAYLAAYSAAQSAYSAAQSAAAQWAAQAAAQAAAQWAAWSAADSAAHSAAYLAAQSAARSAADELLTRMVMAAHAASK